jgi:hypothetical protein
MKLPADDQEDGASCEAAISLQERGTNRSDVSREALGEPSDVSRAAA